jgi:hypothetical protein
MAADLTTYRQAILDIYLRLPDTPRHISRCDLSLVNQLWERNVSLDTLEMALLLATARRAQRPPDAMPLGPVRSLHYYIPVIEELIQTPLSQGQAYLDYLRRKVSLPPRPS